MLLACALVLPAASARARTPKAERTHDVCPRLRFIGPEIKLSEVEKKLVCGDPGSDGWKNVSIPQARGFITAFLQARGYHFPGFGVEGDTLDVRIGTTTVVTKLTGQGLSGIYDLGKRRKIVGQLLTPKLLDTAKQAVVFELQSRGYACPSVVVTADARNGEVHVDADPGGRYEIARIQPAKVQKVDPRVFRRYESFQPGQTFDTRLLSVTSDRVKQDELFLTAYYDAGCSTAGLHIDQKVVEGKPHLLKVGVGADTEGLLQAKGQFKISRLDARASSLEIDVFASSLEESLDALMNYYPSPTKRLFFVPEAFVRREDEIQYEAAHSQVSFSPAWSHDGEDLRVEVRGGPAYDYFNTIRGLGPQRSDWAAFITRTQVMTHLYEYYQRDPRRGWRATLETSSRVRGLASRISANRMQLTGESLWNLGNYEPPLAVLATRGEAATTWVADRSQAFTQIPPTERFFLGGDADIRGFQRNRLPDDAEGFLTALYDGVELRAGDVLPAGVQPLVFIDAAMGGRDYFHVDPDVYYSPGAGVRWAPSFGEMRATFARGLTWRRGSPTEPPRPHWQFFFSFGKEF